MDYYADSGAARPGHVFLSAYLSAIVIALLAATTGPPLLDPALEVSADSDVGGSIFGGTSGNSAAMAFDDEADGSSDRVDVDVASPTDDGAALVETPSLSGAIDDAEVVASALDQIDFDLGETTQSGGSQASLGGNLIEVRKSVFSEGVELGSLSVTIDRNARLFAQRSDLENLLQGDEANIRRIARIGSDGLISFQQLREFGVSLRYDPIADRIVLQPG